MGKNEFLTPKAIANRIKAKGLQKLRWYCQMCQKQCRDENGFKCHCMSESHQRQMQVFGQNPHGIVDGYSEEFERAFMEHMKRSHRFSRVAATVVYNEYITDRHHIHMNSTQWATLTEFVKYLGRTGQCKVEETPKGWFMTYIDRESEAAFKEKQKNKRLKAETVEEERQEKAIAKQIGKTEQSLPKTKETPFSVQSTKLEQCAKVTFALTASKSGITDQAESFEIQSDGILHSVFDEQEEEEKFFKMKSYAPSALDELMREEETVKEKSNRKNYWLVEGIVIKVMSKALKEKGYFKQKGVVQKVVDKYVGEIKMIESGHILRVDQQELETVIPQIGSLVLIINGAYRGSNARLLAINTDNYYAKVQIEKGIYDGRILQAVDYEDICKLMQ